MGRTIKLKIKENNTKNICCNHYKGEGYSYDLIRLELYLCKNCEKKLRKQITDQIKLENNLSKSKPKEVK